MLEHLFSRLSVDLVEVFSRLQLLFPLLQSVLLNFDSNSLRKFRNLKDELGRHMSEKVTRSQF